MLINASRTLMGLMQLPRLSERALSSDFMINRVEIPLSPSRLVSSRSSWTLIFFVRPFSMTSSPL